MARRATRKEVEKATSLQRLQNPTDEQVEELVDFFNFLRADGVRFGNVPVGKYRWVSPHPGKNGEDMWDTARIVLMRNGQLRCRGRVFQGQYFGHRSNLLPYHRATKVERYEELDDALAWVDDLMPDQEDAQFEDGVDEK